MSPHAVAVAAVEVTGFRKIGRKPTRRRQRKANEGEGLKCACGRCGYRWHPDSVQELTRSGKLGHIRYLPGSTSQRLFHLCSFEFINNIIFPFSPEKTRTYSSANRLHPSLLHRHPPRLLQSNLNKQVDARGWADWWQLQGSSENPLDSLTSCFHAKYQWLVCGLWRVIVSSYLLQHFPNKIYRSSLYSVAWKIF